MSNFSFECSVWTYKLEFVVYLKSDLFKSDDGSSSQYAGIRHVDTFKIVAHFLADLAKKEIKFGGKEAFTGWRGRAAAFKAQFLGEFKSICALSVSL